MLNDEQWLDDSIEARSRVEDVLEYVERYGKMLRSTLV